MDWGARLRATWRGEVSNVDLGAMFAATASLDGLRQALADRLLAARIEHAGADWRAPLAVGSVAAPLWLAETLVALAGAFYDAETQAHSDRAGRVSAYTHELVARLLTPVEDIVAEATAALADPARRPALATPLHVGPGGEIADLPLPEPVPETYWRALATAARRTHTAASAALADAMPTLTQSPAPSWMAVGLQRVDGSLRAAGARLDMDEVRLPALAQARGTDPSAPAPFCRDLWLVVDAACIAGQVIADPHLLPEAQAVRSAAPSGQAACAERGQSPLPPVVPRRERTPPLSLPSIPEGAPSASPRPASPPSVPDSAPPTSATHRDLLLPSIGPAASAAGPAHGGDEQPSSPSLPAISGPNAPSATPPAAPHRDAPVRRLSSDDGDDAPFRLPEIGEH